MSETAVLDPNAAPSSSGTPGSSTTQQSQPSTGSTVTESWGAKWAKPDGSLDHSVFEKAPDELKPLAKDLGRYKTLDEFLKGHRELASLAGKKGLVDPLPKDATPEQVAERSALLRKVNGAPEKPEGYGLVRPENVPAEQWDDKYASEIAGIAHKHGLPPAALQELAAAELKFTQQQIEANKQAETQWFEGQDRLIRETLQKEGLDFAKGLDLAQRAGRKYGVDPANPLMKNATVFMLLSRIGNAIKEDEIITGELTGMGLSPNLSPEEANKQADDIMQNPQNPLNKAFKDKNHIDHEKAVAKWHALLKIVSRPK